MAVVHVKKRENPYVQIDKRVFEDPRLSWRAKGIMGYLLSKPNGWKVNVVDIWGKGKEGRNAVQDCMAELKLYGYADLVTTHDENGVFTGKEWVVSEEPKNGFTDTTEKPKTDAPINRKSGFRYNSNNDLNSNNEEKEGPKNTPTTFEEMLDMVNAQAEQLKALKPITNPTHIVTTVEAVELPESEIITGMNTNGETGIFVTHKQESQAQSYLTKLKITAKASTEKEAREEIIKWCEANPEQVKWSYESARRTLTKLELTETIIAFSGHYATTSEVGKQLLFFSDPARMFQNGLTKWLQTQNKFDRDQAAKQQKQPYQQPEQKYVAPQKPTPPQAYYD